MNLFIFSSQRKDKNRHLQQAQAKSPSLTNLDRVGKLINKICLLIFQKPITYKNKIKTPVGLLPPTFQVCFSLSNMYIYMCIILYLT